MRRPRESGEVSFFLHPLVQKKTRLTSLTPDMLTHITPRGISALLGPVGKPTLLAPVGDKKNETYVFNPRYADAYQNIDSSV